MLQFAGETVDEFRLRWNNYNINDRDFFEGQACMQQHLFEYSYNVGHCSFLEEVNIIFIDKNCFKDPKRCENCWRYTLKTMSPLGLNVEDD